MSRLWSPGAPGAAVPGTVRVAALDCGTNSLRLLVADVDPVARTLVDVDRRMEIVRLGQGVDATGRLAPEALTRTLTVLEGYAAIIGQAGATAVRMVATSATRDASNAADFVAGVEAVLGIQPEVVTGEEEARLSFTGATAEFAGVPAAERVPASGPAVRTGTRVRGEASEPPYLVVDIGGGSTEFVLGEPGEVLAAASIDIGCVRMTERHLRDDPPTSAQITAARADVEAALDLVAAQVPVAQARTLVGLAGSVTTVAALALGIDAYDPSLIHHAHVTVGEVREITRRLLGQSRAERAGLSVMHPGRVDVIGGGAMVLDAIMNRFGFAEVVASEHNILDGLAWSLVTGSGQ